MRQPIPPGPTWVGPRFILAATAEGLHVEPIAARGARAIYRTRALLDAWARSAALDRSTRDLLRTAWRAVLAERSENRPGPQTSSLHRSTAERTPGEVQARATGARP